MHVSLTFATLLASASAIDTGSSSIPTLATWSAVSCPDANNTIYTSSNGAAFAIECGIDHEAGDMSWFATNDLGICIESCATTTRCVDVSLSGDACYLKSSLGAALSDSLIVGARLVDISCSGSNNTIYSYPSGATFKIECGVDHVGGDMGSATVSSLAACIQACATTPGCVDVSLSGTACYMKQTLGTAISDNTIQGARLVSGQAASSSLPASSSTVSSSSSSSVESTSTSTAPISIAPTSIAPTSIVSTSIASTSTAPISTPTVSGLPQGWSYQGCWIDNANGRILQDSLANDEDMTIASCSQTCLQAGFSVAGMEYTSQCFCGNTVIDAGTLAAQDSDCAMPCGGNPGEICGGPDRMSLYSASAVKVLGLPVAQNTSLPGSWQYAGCHTDNVPNGGHVLPWQLIVPNNDANSCLSQCSAFGYMVGGMEYGDECYCGDLDDLTNGGSVPVPESDCSKSCPGNGTYLCGAGNRLSLYQWTENPLYTWKYASGNAAGSYEYFTPGVIVPLITSAGKNGKITFVEKHGTSVYPNSTGAFEFDPSLSDDFSECWREMTGITTDVFCSAGLVLPDAGARQINVGGWSLESTFGVRFYTPDGAPGINSTNHWEENSDEIHLEKGRWYPSAMIMTNGSILVVGGEDGSNGKAVPSLELLPPAGPVVNCSWLAESDPYNLYPFLAVLPSGGIFVAYWNQARILDPITFETRQLLPQIPGTVALASSGRTYPFEGTSVLLPQRAPYTDPLDVLICGGSGEGAAVAIDNCVSIQPDVPNANWTLERMPSKRVMSCMVALPDGTYLILNGAQQGNAGFGLATDPNYNAILYDPSQPVGARITLMANTTIARLYHSEAVLMDDGRVLVSGSDPQDSTHPEEMRVEVFNPPYILNMDPATRPSFTLINGDSFDYADTITIAFTGAIPSAISLLGAVASTHGNSMGQRTIFPAFQCEGITCTVTTPPSANVAPPGWFQMFVLDGPTPSTAQWVRIGGDPAGLGEWPEGEGFTRPGS